MKKNLKKRLEKALCTLKEPGGSTIRSIIKVINKDGPILSLRKVLEALQEGINEGFLCMYNGRFKLKQHLQNGQYPEENTERKNKNQLKKNDEELLKTSESENEESEAESEDDAEIGFDEKYKLSLKKSVNRGLNRIKPKQGQRGKMSRPMTKSKKQCYLSKKTKKKSKKDDEKICRRRCNMILDKADCGSLLEITPNMPEKKLTRPTTEKPDLKKQRGPRCTSMKKDVRMPSKVHIPFVPPSVPQKTNNFNDLLRRSPEPVNGPLYDNFMVTSDNFAFFKAYC